jgi:hypothetical protein
MFLNYLGLIILYGNTIIFLYSTNIRPSKYESSIFFLTRISEHLSSKTNKIKHIKDKKSELFFLQVNNVFYPIKKEFKLL